MGESPASTQHRERSRASTRAAINALFLGRRQKGKTTLAVYTALQIQQHSGKGIVIYDLNSQVTAWPDSVYTDLESVNQALEVKQPLIIYRPDQDNVEDDFRAFCDLIWPLTNYVLVIDEAHWLQSPQWAHPCLAKYVRMADPYGVDLIQVAHAPADLWGRARSLASDWYIFPTTRPADLDAIELQCGEEIREQIATLGLHDYIHWNADVHSSELVNDPAVWYIDIKTPRTQEVVYGRQAETRPSVAGGV